jgi:type II secretion system protein G
MLTRIMKPREDRDAGFTLIELLVVVAIIGILAAIAIPVFLNQRASARDASVKSDINSVAKVMETVYTDTGAYPTADAAGEALLVANDVVSSPGNYIQVVPTATAFEIYGCNVESDNGWYYSSSAGGLNPDGQTYTGTACDAAGGIPGDTVPPQMEAPASAAILFTAPS